MRIATRVRTVTRPLKHRPRYDPFGGMRIHSWPIPNVRGILLSTRSRAVRRVTRARKRTDAWAWRRKTAAPRGRRRLGRRRLPQCCRCAPLRGVINDLEDELDAVLRVVHEGLRVVDLLASTGHVVERGVGRVAGRG